MKKAKINKKKVLLFLVFPLIIIVSAILLFFYFKSKELIVEYETEMKVSLGTEASILDGIQIKNGRIKTEDVELDTSKIGKQEVTFQVEDKFGNRKEYKREIIIVDTESPKIEFKEKIEVSYCAEVDLLKDVKATDNSNEEIKVEVEGDYDTCKTGEQELYYIARDSSENETKEKFILIVKEKEVAPKPSVPNGMPDKTFTTSKGFKGETKNGMTYIDGYLIANKTYSLPSTYNPGGLTSETSTAASKMFAAAELEGLPHMWAQSGFRSYTTQSSLYNNYAARDGKAAADTYSARPGHSEHQTGLAFDVCATGYACITSGFNGTTPANWLSKNAYKYGFILRYPQGKTNETGYVYESWHFRYVGTELAEKLYNNGDWITLENYFGIDSVYSY